MTAEATTADASAAVGALFETHGERVLRMGLHFCRSPDRAADLVQETFLRALSAWPDFEGRSEPSTWLYTIAVRACRRMERRRAGEPPSFESIEAEALRGRASPHSESSALDRLIREETRERVRAAVRSLEADFRVPLWLKDMEGLSIAQIAEILDLKPATVKTRVHRARMRLAEALREECHRDTEAERGSTECLDLLEARLSAEDRGIPFPLPAETMCRRCRATLEGLDMASSVCAALGGARIDADLLQEVRRRLWNGSDAGNG